eukprot:312119-Prymnesium_polylepis.1
MHFRCLSPETRSLSLTTPPCKKASPRRRPWGSGRSADTAEVRGAGGVRADPRRSARVRAGPRGAAESAGGPRGSARVRAGPRGSAR